MSARVAAAMRACTVLGILVAGYVLHQLVGEHPSPLSFKGSHQVWRAVEGVVIGIAISLAWLATGSRRAALGGLALALLLLVVGAVWPMSALGASAAVFALPLVGAMSVRVAVGGSHKPSPAPEERAERGAPLSRE